MSTAVRGSLVRRVWHEQRFIPINFPSLCCSPSAHRLIVGIGAGAHFCAFARFSTGLQTFPPAPNCVSTQVAGVMQRPYLNMLYTKASLRKLVEILKGDKSLLSGRLHLQALLTSVVSGK